MGSGCAASAGVWRRDQLRAAHEMFTRMGAEEATKADKQNRHAPPSRSGQATTIGISHTSGVDPQPRLDHARAPTVIRQIGADPAIHSL